MCDGEFLTLGTPTKIVGLNFWMSSNNSVTSWNITHSIWIDIIAQNKEWNGKEVRQEKRLNYSMIESNWTTNEKRIDSSHCFVDVGKREVTQINIGRTEIEPCHSSCSTIWNNISMCQHHSLREITLCQWVQQNNGKEKFRESNETMTRHTFGSPVVPLVYMIQYKSLGCGGAKGTGFWLPFTKQNFESLFENSMTEGMCRSLKQREDHWNKNKHTLFRISSKLKSLIFGRWATSSLFFASRESKCMTVVRYLFLCATTSN